jgi:hypothetical protein
MKKSFFTIFVIISLFLSFTAVRAQIHISLGPQLGFALPMSDYAGGVTDFYNGTKYGLKGGFNMGATFKADLMIIAGRLDINYAMFSNSGSITGTDNGSLSIKQKNLIIGVGPEFSFGVPMIPIKPYVSLELLFTTFTGESQYQGNPGGVNNNNNSMTSATRIGLGLLAGTEFKIGVFALDVSVRYNMLNLIGKSFTSYNNIDRTNSYLNLNDAKDPNFDGVNHPVGTSRTISTLQFNVGVLFGI